MLTITAAELYLGAYHSQRIEKNVRAVDDFFAQFPRANDRSLVTGNTRLFKYIEGVRLENWIG